MYRILLAEDEQNMLNAMLQATPWQEFGFDSPYPCSNGQEAIDALKAGLRPDLVITDICMPVADGLVLAAYVREHLPDTMVVILSGYDDFQYAQQALRLQVYEYILKPFTPKQLCELLDRLRREITRRRDGDETTRLIVQHHFLNRLITQTSTPELIAEHARLHGIELRAPYYAVASLDPDLPVPASPAETAARDCLRYGLYNVCEELLRGREDSQVFQGRFGVTKLLVGGETAAGCADTLQAQAAQLIERASDCLECTISAGIGQPVRSTAEIVRSHEHSREALEQRFYRGDGALIFWKDGGFPSERLTAIGPYEERLLSALRHAEREDACTVIRQLAGRMADMRIPPADCCSHMRHLLSRAVSTAEELTNGHSLSDEAQQAAQLDTRHCVTLPQLTQDALRLCGRLFDALREASTDAAALQVRRAQAYIRERYADPELSLNDITSYLAVSTSYFSTLFKGGTGMTFLEYLTGVRMEKAREILTFTDLRSCEIAEKIGFSDPHYFSAAFKRATGLTPREYRERSRRETAGTSKK